MSLILWAIATIVILVAFGSLARQFPWMESDNLEAVRGAGFSGGGARPPAASRDTQAPEQGFDPLSRENLARLCGKFRIREISLLPFTCDAGARAGARLRVLVEFERRARTDYQVFVHLSSDLFAMLGRRVDLVCKNSTELVRQQEAFAQARVLYAA
jgi:predicted nucleotidyltransferase